MKQLRAAELAARLGDPSQPRPYLLDVREAWEYEICHIDGARLLPLGRLAEVVDTLDPAAPTVVICHHGVRSLHAAAFLETRGFTDVINLQGGVAAWADEVDPGMPRY